MPTPPFRLAPFFSPRPWGRPHLRPWFPETGTTELVGEAWLTAPTSRIEDGPFTGETLAAAVTAHPADLLAPGTPPEFPLLIKLLFPNDKLSVQVHPDDTQAQAIGQSRGKTECWYVLQADPGATVALGLKPGITSHQLRASALDNSMEALIHQLPVAVGDMVFVDAGTIHAIGPGVVLLETQQTSDITYRLFDYGRPRELHLDQGLQVLRTETAAGKVAPLPLAAPAPGVEATRLIAQHYFTVDRYHLPAGATFSLAAAGLSGCLVTLDGSGSVANSAGAAPLAPNQAVILPATSGSLQVTAAAPLTVIHCFEPTIA